MVLAGLSCVQKVVAENYYLLNIYKCFSIEKKQLWPDVNGEVIAEDQHSVCRRVRGHK